MFDFQEVSIQPNLYNILRTKNITQFICQLKQTDFLLSFKKNFFVTTIKEVIEEHSNYFPTGIDKDKIAEHIADGLLKKIKETEQLTAPR